MTDTDQNSDTNDKANSSGMPKVLLVEDNAVVLKGLHNLLKKWGYDPIKANDGTEAWDILEKNHDIHLAILDWNLPGIDGLKICQKLRQRTSGPYVYTIMFSVRKSNEERIQALTEGADDYIVKPCKPSLLYAKLLAGSRILKMAAKVALPDIVPQSII